MTIPAAVQRERQSWHMGPWDKRSEPILSPSPRGFDSRNIYNVATVSVSGETWMIFRGEDAAEPPTQVTGRLGLAISRDGVHFERQPEPILVPQEDYESRGVEDPRLIQVDGLYHLTYTAYDGQTARLCQATSRDLKTWQRHGVIFPSFPATNHWTKSGAVLPERLPSGPYRGKYPMYFGDSNIWLAVSDDLLHWDLIEQPVLEPRAGFFDSRLVEPGPPPLRTRDGLLLIYNSADTDNRYAAGFALYDLHDPTRLLQRSRLPFIEPTQEWEKVGYVPNVVFVEGLEVRDGKWHLYFGGADRHVGLATCPFDPELLPTDSPWLQGAPV